jgi:hypothetical protein
VAEHDLPPGQMLVLCVAAVRVQQTSPPVAAVASPAPPRACLPLRLSAGAVAGADAAAAAGAVVELTDGWYSLPAVLDPALSALVRRGALREGCKLRIAGATVRPPSLRLSAAC